MRGRRSTTKLTTPAKRVEVYPGKTMGQRFWSRVRLLEHEPKVHLIDSELAASTSGLTAADWLEQRDRMGHLLESFVVPIS